MLPDVLLTALKPIATLETSLEANYDTTRTPHGHHTDTTRTKLLMGARATTLPKNLWLGSNYACGHFVDHFTIFVSKRFLIIERG